MLNASRSVDVNAARARRGGPARQRARVHDRRRVRRRALGSNTRDALDPALNRGLPWFTLRADPSIMLLDPAAEAKQVHARRKRDRAKCSGDGFCPHRHRR